MDIYALGLKNPTQLTIFIFPIASIFEYVRKKDVTKKLKKEKNNNNNFRILGDFPPRSEASFVK